MRPTFRRGRAGCILSELKDAIAEMGMFCSACTRCAGKRPIGGNVSTNAGGINVLRYGMTRELCWDLKWSSRTAASSKVCRL